MSCLPSSPFPKEKKVKPEMGATIRGMPVEYRHHSLEDFLISAPLTANIVFDDGWGARFPLKGRTIEATMLFADITSFTARTLDLTPEETLSFVNNFFAWVTVEALRDRPGIVDKYIGDELMIVFSEEFGSDDPFTDAVQAARWMAQDDAHSFCPHIGLASGKVIVGYVGTPLKYNCSVFGAPVALAARCAGLAPDPAVGGHSTAIVFPAAEWGDRVFDEVFLPRRYKTPEGGLQEETHGWELLDPRTVDLKNIGKTEVREIVNRAIHIPSQSAEESAKEGLAQYRNAWKNDCQA
jgi:class 3 adenylate cyclase